MDYLFLIGADRTAGALEPADVVSRAIWQLGSVGLRLQRQGGQFTAPGEPDGAGPPVLWVAVEVSCDLHPVQVFDRARRVAAATAGSGGLAVLPVAAADLIYPDEDTVARAIEAHRTDVPVLPAPTLHCDAALLVPVAALWPDWRHPILGRTTRELLSGLLRQAVEEIGQAGQAPPLRDAAE